MLTKEILGKEVIASNGFKLGTITEVEFDEHTWKINSLEVHLEKDIAEEYNLRQRLKKTKVLIHADHVQAVGEKVILKGAREDLLKLIGSAPQAADEPQQKEEPRPTPIDASVSTETPEQIKS
jgi:sporulation protein YlmC with PRC-barrel domain